MGLFGSSKPEKRVTVYLSLRSGVSIKEAMSKLTKLTDHLDSDEQEELLDCFDDHHRCSVVMSKKKFKKNKEALQELFHVERKMTKKEREDLYGSFGNSTEDLDLDDDDECEYA